MSKLVPLELDSIYPEISIMIDVRFGYLHEPAELTWSAGRIAPLAAYHDIVEQVRARECAYGDWYYPPLVPVAQDSKESKKAPVVTTGFSLPATHMLSLSDGRFTDECAIFFIALFGMLKGRRLQREEWRHFYKAPINRKLCDFLADDNQITLALNRVTDFWLEHPDVETRKLSFGALHWHLFAQLYEYEFERFNAQYMALDTCYRLAVRLNLLANNIPHARRPSRLGKEIGVPVPDWAIVHPGQEICALSERRNALIHEAMYGGQPVGFAYPGDQGEMELQLPGLVARILLRLLGIDNEYTRSECTTYQTFGFAP